MIEGLGSFFGSNNSSMFGDLESSTSEQLQETISHRADMAEMQAQGEAALAAISIMQNISSAAFQASSQASAGFQRVA